MTRTFALALVVLIAVAPLKGQVDPCKVIVEAGIFNSSTVQSGSTAETRFNEWLCATNFGTFEELNRSGIGIGATVYGIPVTGSWTSTAEQRRTWKESHCQSSSAAANYSTLYQAATSTVAPEVVNAWSSCINSVYGERPGLRCSVSVLDSATALFSIKFSPIDNNDTVVPTVVDSSIVGGRALTGSVSAGGVLTAGKSIGQTYTTVSISREGVTPVSLVVNTTRGSCSGYVPAPVVAVRAVALIVPKGDKAEYGNDVLQLDDGSDDCGINENRTARKTVGSGWTIAGWGSPSVSTSNCPTGKSYPMVNTIRKENSDTTLAIDYHLEGCGKFLFTCKGRGWLGFTLPITTVRYVPANLPEYRWESGTVAPSQQWLVDYPSAVPPDYRNVRYEYRVDIERIVRMGDLVLNRSTLTLSDSAPSAGGVATSIANGRLVITTDAVLRTP